MKTRVLPILLLALLSGCDRDSVAPAPESPAPELGSIEDAIVRANCLTVQAAAEEFTRENDEVCPMDVGADCTPTGFTLTDFLPDGSLLENPYTTACSEPLSGEAACPGEAGYESVEENGMSVGYEITGVGALAGQQIVKLTDIDSPEGIVKRNCRLLKEALWYFWATNNDEYPVDINSDTTSTGETVLSFLYGYTLENPYTGEPVRLVNGPAFLPGEIGYEAISAGDTVYACKVTGVGESPGRVVFEHRHSRLEEEGRVSGWCDILRSAAERFAAWNDGKYPRDLDSDISNDGHTLLDLIQGYFLNPFTQSRTEPRIGRAVNPGEVGYQPMDGGWGYAITGVGKKQGELIWKYYRTTAPVDTMVSFNCTMLAEVVERFTFMNGGIPPKDIDRDTTLSGKTIIDLLPAGIPVLNPVTRKRTEPQDHAAAYPGQTGYQFSSSDEYYAYIITGIDEKGAYIYRTHKYIARNAAAAVSPAIQSGRP